MVKKKSISASMMLELESGHHINVDVADNCVSITNTNGEHIVIVDLSRGPKVCVFSDPHQEALTEEIEISRCF
jgi:hypothetical protein